MGRWTTCTCGSNASAICARACGHVRWCLSWFMCQANGRIACQCTEGILSWSLAALAAGHHPAADHKGRKFCADYKPVRCSEPDDQIIWSATTTTASAKNRNHRKYGQSGPQPKPQPRPTTRTTTTTTRQPAAATRTTTTRTETTTTITIIITTTMPIEQQHPPQQQQRQQRN